MGCKQFTLPRVATMESVQQQSTVEEDGNAPPNHVLITPSTVMSPKSTFTTALVQQGLSLDDAKIYSNQLLLVPDDYITYEKLHAITDADVRRALGSNVPKLHMSAILRAAKESVLIPPPPPLPPPDLLNHFAKKSTHRGFLTSFTTWRETWLPNHYGVVWGVSFNASGDEFFSACEDGKVGVWHAIDGGVWEHQTDLKHHSTDALRIAAVRCVCTSQSYVATGGLDRIVWLLEAHHPYAVVHSIQAHESTVQTLCFDSKTNPSLLLSGDHAGTVCLSRVSDGIVLRKFISLHDACLSNVTFVAPATALGATTFITVSWDCLIKVVDVTDILAENAAIAKDNGDVIIPRLVFNAHVKDARCIVLLNNGLFAVSAGEDTQVLVWELSKGRVIQSENQGSWVTAMAISPCETLLATGGFRTIILWNVNGVNEGPHITRVHEIHAFPNWIKSICFHPCGDSLLASSEDTSVNLKIWTDRG